jgi:hypothetical protein
VFAALRQGIDYAGKDAGMRLLLVACAVVAGLLMTCPTLFPAIAHGLGEGASGNAYLGGAAGVGAFAGALLMPVIVGNRNWVVVLAGLALVGGCAMIGLGWAPELWSACGFAAIVGFAVTTYMTVTASTLQLRAAGELMGRVTSLYFVAMNTGLVAGSLGLGALAKDASSLFMPLAIAGGALGLFAVMLASRASIGAGRAS